MATEIKIIMLGKQGVGKTSLLRKYKEGVFSQHMVTTIGLDYISDSFTHQGDEVHLQIWDTAGQERYFSMASKYFKGSQIALLTVSAQSPAQQSLKDIEQLLGLYYQNSRGKAVYVFVNKIDLVEVQAMQRDWQ